ncbi:MAG TPA: hypothetical protein VF263_00655 [Longimicrobiaceae bacterium]
MSETQPTPVTPRETVLLHGRRFAGEVGMLRAREELLTGEGKVSTDQLAEAALAAAVLGMERAGDVRLEARAKKALFGLISRRALFASPAGAGSWPEGTVEWHLRRRLAGETEVADLVHDWLEHDTTNPASDVLARVKRGLAARGLLEEVEVKKLKIFTAYEYRLPESTAAAARGHSPDGVRALLDGAERSRSEVWQLLKKQIGSALARRTEQSDAGGPD